MNGQVGDVIQVQRKLYSAKDATYNTLSPILWLLNIFAINCNVDDGFSKFFDIAKSLLTMVFLGGLNVYSIYYKYTFVYPLYDISTSIKLTDLLQMTYDFCQYVVDLWFVNKYGKRISLEYFQQYTYIDPILHMNGYEIIKKKLARLLGFFTLIWLISSGCDFASWYSIFGLLTPTWYAVAYIFLYIKILTTLDLTSHVMHIEFRLKIMGDIVHQCYLTSEELPGFLGDVKSSKNWLHSRFCPSASKQVFKLGDESNTIKLLTRCYLQVTEQVEFINCMFGFRLLLNSLSLLIDIIRFTNLAVRIVLGTQIVPHNVKCYPAVASVMRQITCVLVLISLATHCERAYRQRKRIINTIDHLLINRKPGEKLRIVMTELRQLVQDHPIHFNLDNFFRLDNKLLVSIASVVVTYTIILLQTMN